MNKYHTLTILLLIFASIGTACLQKESNGKPELNGQDTISVTIARVSTLPLHKNIQATGVVATENEVRYAFKIGGIIDKIFVKEGQFFKKGQILAALKTKEIETQWMQANLGLEKAQRDFSRIDNLFRDSVATKEQWENAQTALDIARQSVEAVTFNRQYTTIKASGDGFVTKKLAQEGEVIGGGMPVLIINETSGNSAWVLKAGVTDKEWAQIQAGMKATVTLDAYPESTFSATVSRKNQAADPYSGSFTIELRMEILSEKPAVGMFGKASIETGNIQIYHTIPHEALIEANGKTGSVFVPFEKSLVKKIPVFIGFFDEEKVVISSGLENVEEIIVGNSAFLNENSKIHIIKSQP